MWLYKAPGALPWDRPHGTDAPTYPHLCSTFTAPGELPIGLQSTSKWQDRGSNLAFHVPSSDFGSHPEEAAGLRRMLMHPSCVLCSPRAMIDSHGQHFGIV